MRKCILVLIIFVVNINLYSQVITTIFPKGNGFKEFPMLDQVDLESIPLYEMPLFNLDSVIQEERILDEKGVGRPFRFGYAFDVDYGMEYGKWVEVADKRIWNIRFKSKNAYTLNLRFTDLTLTSQAELYIYNSNSTFIYGPITSKNNATEEFKTIGSDLIDGEEVIIQIIEPKPSKQTSSLKVTKVVHGFINHYSDILPDKNKQDNSFQALSCHIDIACKSDWENESRGIVRIVVNDNSLCSGALLNNQLGTNRPFILTAFHCADDNDNGSLSTDEKTAAMNTTFIFNYKKATCNGSNPTSWKTYPSGVYYRAAFKDTDFLLLESKETITDSEVRFLGWDARPHDLNKGICIHHPAGEPMKISIDNSTVDLLGTIYIDDNWNLFPAYTHLDVYFDEGAVEGGSSGSPLFDQKKRIKGQLHGGVGSCGLNMKVFGSFFVSFGGGGSDETSLVNWLVPYSPGLDQTNTIGPCQSTNFWNRVVNRDERIICKDINVKDVIVKSGKKLELESTGGSVIINSGFTVEEGASFIIK